ncbi:PBP1 and LysM peptidoglycan-binding domain-containing protein [Carboxylicivirga linearis]|uniref:LysM peptidoglycan-binding domain-containing protein n=1 Tax=Carboxylicivirga linearis TaxID=1628157 RepID=A0ABS5K0A1_9BACT|nr:LysM peptidoglycan-binding domain-containing protein [Carboxylicivirga linearis]MBS2100566.1 LysM peptidoglycan-binding domain-containing protein [Carboxylicivirga linearis]
MKRINYIVLKLSIAMLFVVFTAQAQQYDGMEKIVIDGEVYYLYKVKKSEGLYRISVNYGVSQKELLEANPDAAFGLKEGQLLKIPVISGRNSTKQEIQSTSYIYHTVEQGQTVYFISKKYDVPLKVIYDNNPGSDQTLIKGTIIKIPKELPKEQVTEENENENYIIHIVQPKETMYALSKTYNVSIPKIIESNPALKSGILEIGSSIRIPQEAKEVAVVKNEKQELEDDMYIYHSIEEGETLYSIAQHYNAKPNDVVEANPSADASDLKLGYLVRVPKASIKASKEEVEKGDNLFIYHKVKRKETLFAISRKYNVDVEIIKSVNSDKDLTRLRKGDKIKVPNRYWFKAIHEKEEELAEDAAKEREEVMDLTELDCNSYDYYLEKQTLKVAIMLPFNVEATLKANIIEEEDDEGEITEREREEKVVSRYSKVFVEFYQGALLGLEKLKEQGVNVEMFVYDTAPDSNKVKSILSNAEMPYMNLIIGPAYPQHLSFVSDFSKEHSIPMVYPFSTINHELTDNIHMFQAMPIDTLLFDKMADKMLESSVGKRIVIIRTEDAKSEFENKFSELIRNKVYWESFKEGVVPDFVEYKFKQDDLASLEKMFAKDKANTVIVPSIEEAQVNRIITTIKGAQSKTKADVTLWGLPEWLKYQTINPEDIHSLKGHMFSYYSVDYENKESSELISEYRKWFRTEPMAISPYFQNANVTSNISRYSLWGFDITYYFLSALKEYGKNFEYCISKHHPYAVQSPLNFERTSNWGGYYNSGLYLLKFDPDYSLKVEQVNK